jgi:imidazolonepropionase
MWDALWINGHLATMTEGHGPYGALEDAALAVRDGRIAWLGPRAELSADPVGLARQVHDMAGCWMTPGLIDCHTHLVWGGDRAREFELRLEGASYEELAKAGGGILSTVKATRETDAKALYDAAAPRLKSLMAEGVTTVEIKSGYGLEADSEAKQLAVARRLGKAFPVTVVTTFLGAHAIPPEFKNDSGGYIDRVVNDMLPSAHAQGLVDMVDAFCESIAFSPGETERVFAKARELGLPVKLHADQLSDLNGAALAARFGALSAEHLEWTNADGIRAMAEAGTVAVLLPGAFYQLRETKLPPIQGFRDAGVPMAIATDCNPGSAPVFSLLLMLNMACILFRMTPEEALAGVTRNAARALGKTAEVGTLEVGKHADLAVWRISRPADLAYRIGFNPLVARVKHGQVSSIGIHS